MVVHAASWMNAMMGTQIPAAVTVSAGLVAAVIGPDLVRRGSG